MGPDPPRRCAPGCRVRVTWSQGGGEWVPSGDPSGSGRGLHAVWDSPRTAIAGRTPGCPHQSHPIASSNSTTHSPHPIPPASSCPPWDPRARTGLLQHPAIPPAPPATSQHPCNGFRTPASPPPPPVSPPVPPVAPQHPKQWLQHPCKPPSIPCRPPSTSAMIVAPMQVPQHQCPQQPIQAPQHPCKAPGKLPSTHATSPAPLQAPPVPVQAPQHLCNSSCTFQAPPAPLQAPPAPTQWPQHPCKALSTHAIMPPPSSTPPAPLLSAPQAIPPALPPVPGRCPCPWLPRMPVPQ